MQGILCSSVTYQLSLYLHAFFHQVMKITLAFALLVGPIWCQTWDDDTLIRINELFPTAGPTTPCTFPCLDGLREVTTPNSSDTSSYILKCGEGDRKEKELCVNYEYCDGTTKTIVENGFTDSFGIINIRSIGKCSHPLEICCNIPKGGLSPTFDPQGKPSTPAPTTVTPATRPSSTTSSTGGGQVPLTCGVRNQGGIDFQIIGNNNNEAGYGEFPWMVAVIKRRSQIPPFSCGGSIISPNFVLTAAHCVFNNRETPGDFKIRAGEWDSQTERERLPYQERQVVEIITHTLYQTAGLFSDVAVLRLDSPLNYDKHISPICLPQQDQVIESSNCFVTGWGKNIFGSEGLQGVHQQILKRVELGIVPFEKCQNDLRKTRLGPRYRLHDSFVCAGGEEGKDACTGDGGSPLVCPIPNNPNQYVIVGMVAWGVGCGQKDVPGVYVNVPKFVDWLKDKTGN